jgi:hypothetical protein
MAQIIPLQGELRPVLPTVLGNVDVQRFEAELRRIVELLRLSGVEALFAERGLAGWLARDPERVPTTHEQTKYQRTSAQALRCNMLQRLLGEDFRGMTRRLAECAPFQWFCGVDRLEEVRVPSKSQLARYFQWLPEAQVEALGRPLVQAAREADAATGCNRLWLAKELKLDTVWMDSTCVAVDRRLVQSRTSLAQLYSLSGVHDISALSKRAGVLVTSPPVLKRVASHMTLNRKKAAAVRANTDTYTIAPTTKGSLLTRWQVPLDPVNVPVSRTYRSSALFCAYFDTVKVRARAGRRRIGEFVLRSGGREPRGEGFEGLAEVSGAMNRVSLSGDAGPLDDQSTPGSGLDVRGGFEDGVWIVRVRAGHDFGPIGDAVAIGVKIWIHDHWNRQVYALDAAAVGSGKGEAASGGW